MQNEKDEWRYVALGDSQTEGLNDGAYPDTAR